MSDILEQSLSQEMQIFIKSINAVLADDVSANFIKAIGGEQVFIDVHADVIACGGDCGLEGLTTNLEVQKFYCENKDGLIAYLDIMAQSHDYDDTADFYVGHFGAWMYEPIDAFNALEVDVADVEAAASMAGKKGACLTDIIRFLVFNGISKLCSEYAGLLEEGSVAYFENNRTRKLGIDDQD